MNEQREKQRGNPAKVLPYRIKKGETRNPKGFSKKARELFKFRQWIKETCPNDPVAVFKRLSDLAKNSRDFRYLQEYLDRVEGKVPNKNEISGADGQPISVNISVTSPKAKEALTKIIAG